MYVQLTTTIELNHSDGWHNKQPLLCDHGIIQTGWVNSLCQTMMHIHNRIICNDHFNGEGFLKYILHENLQKTMYKTSVLTLELCKEMAIEGGLSWE